MPGPLLMFVAGGALGLLARPAIEDRRDKKKKEEAQSIAHAISEALKEQNSNSATARA